MLKSFRELHVALRVFPVEKDRAGNKLGRLIRSALN